jgi:hypothetical protein
MNRKNNVTYVNDLLDLNDVPSDYDKKIIQENDERSNYTLPIKAKIRNNVDYRYAVNGGMNEPEPEYIMGPRVVQRHHEQIEPAPIFRINCIDIANHISGCPICSKLYGDDKTPYMIVIVLLVVVCIILLKKVIDKQ